MGNSSMYLKASPNKQPHLRKQVQTKATRNYEYLQATIQENKSKVSYNEQTWQHTSVQKHVLSGD